MGEDQSRERGERDASRKGMEVEVGESRGRGAQEREFPICRHSLPLNGKHFGRSLSAEDPR